jgi:quinol-cytochrome oxidoreductase complex cytochrome b subunit
VRDVTVLAGPKLAGAGPPERSARSARSAHDRVAGTLLGVAAAEFAALVGSGAFLVFFYRPAATSGISNLTSESGGDHLVDVVRSVHRAMAGAMTLTLVVVATAGVVALARRGRTSRRGVVAAGVAVGLAAVGLAAVVTGYLLPWNQLFLWAEKVASDIRGFRLFIWHPSVIEHATVRGSEVSITSLRWWLLVHIAVIPAVIIGLGVVALRRILGSAAGRAAS